MAALVCFPTSPNIEDISDDFSFSRSDDGTYEYEHSVDIKFVDTRGTPQNALLMGYDKDNDKYEMKYY